MTKNKNKKKQKKNSNKNDNSKCTPKDAAETIYVKTMIHFHKQDNCMHQSIF